MTAGQLVGRRRTLAVNGCLAWTSLSFPVRSGISRSARFLPTGEPFSRLRPYFSGRGWAWKNFHISSSALIEKVVGPRMFPICRENSLPGHVCPPPAMR